jgi:hypothetical protein
MHGPFFASSTIPRRTTITESCSRTTVTRIEIGSIGVQFDGWSWAIDNAIPMREVEVEGKGKDRVDCMRRLRTAWDKFSTDRARLTEFLNVKRARR